MIQVKDGSRTLQFSGKLLGRSSSSRPGANRWIEFELYKTENGSYVLSRVGVSVIYHTAACHLVQRYGLNEVVASEAENAGRLISCEDCRPTLNANMIFPEKNRYWAQVSDDPSAVLDALYKYDTSGAKYLTHVAQRLLEDAAAVDKGIESVYKIEVIP
jgi:hypothetical protein